MKKCDFCAKEISYYDQYCNEECEQKALRYYAMVERYAKLFMIVNTICVFGFTVFLFIGSLYAPIGFPAAAVCCFVMGGLLIVLPFPTESMIKKHKIQKAMKMCRIFGGVVIALGFAVLGMMFIALSA